MNDLSSSNLEQFDYLQQTGMLASLESLKRENRELKRTVRDIARLISFTDIDSMLDYLIGQFLDYFMPQSVLFVVKIPRKEQVRQFFYQRMTRSNYQMPAGSFETLHRYFSEFTPAELYGKTFSFNEINSELDSAVLGTLYSDLKPKFIIPLVGIGGVYGISIIGEKIVGNDYSAAELDYMHRMFSVLSVTMQNGLHYESSISDPKTGLYTCDYFFTRLSNSIAASRRYGRTAAMLMLDIDHFKRFNDTYGHLVGDKVLVALSDTLRRTVRAGDCVARFGGEEFSVLLSECRRDDVFMVAERIRKAVEGMNFQDKGQIIPITVSVGGFFFCDMPNISPDYITSRADRALYYSKEHGRNRTTIFMPGLLDRANLELLP